MKNIIVFLIVMLFIGIADLKAQDLDRIIISSGGLTDDNMNATIGQTFVFALDSGGICLNMGAQSDTSYGGGSTQTTVIENTETIKSGTIKYYPNPVKDVLNIRLKNFSEKSYELRIFDMTGKIIMLNSFTPDEFLLVDVNKLSPAYYSVIISNRKGRLIDSFKFLKVN